MCIRDRDRVIFDGNKSKHCDCEPIENGFWVYYYDNGNIKEQGSFDCGKKIGTWISFHENGMIQQVTNFAKPYSEGLVRQFGDILNLRRTNPMKHGQFLEYNDSGRLKTSGQYDILHIKTTVDSLVLVDELTFEKTYKKIEGEYWLPQSVKSGTWKYYDQDGNIIKVENHTKEEYEWRDLDDKYWELFNVINKEKDTHDK